MIETPILVLHITVSRGSRRIRWNGPHTEPLRCSVAYYSSHAPPRRSSAAWEPAITLSLAQTHQTTATTAAALHLLVWPDLMAFELWLGSSSWSWLQQPELTLSSCETSHHDLVHPSQMPPSSHHMFIRYKSIRGCSVIQCTRVSMFKFTVPGLVSWCYELTSSY